MEENTKEKSTNTPKADVPKKFEDIVAKVEALTVIELNELVKVFEERFGVSAASFASAPAQGADANDEEESSTVSIEISQAGDQKIQVIKAIKEILSLGLKEAKDMVDAAPTMVKEGVSKEEAKEIQAKLEAAGAKITLK